MSVRLPCVLVVVLLLGGCAGPQPVVFPDDHRRDATIIPPLRIDAEIVLDGLAFTGFGRTSMWWDRPGIPDCSVAASLGGELIPATPEWGCALCTLIVKNDRLAVGPVEDPDEDIEPCDGPNPFGFDRDGYVPEQFFRSFKATGSSGSHRIGLIPLERLIDDSELYPGWSLSEAIEYLETPPTHIGVIPGWEDTLLGGPMERIDAGRSGPGEEWFLFWYVTVGPGGDGTFTFHSAWTIG